MARLVMAPAAHAIGSARCSGATGEGNMDGDRQLPRYGHYIDGAVVPPQSSEYLPTEDPFTGKVWAEVPRGSKDDVDSAVDAAHRALTEGEWPKLSPTERGHLLWTLGDLIAANADRLAAIERRDNGKLAS